MKWDYWISLYTRTHCVARGLRPSSIAAYDKSLRQFRDYVRFRLDDRPPDRIVARDVLEYLQHLRLERHNGESAVNRHVVILRSFYRAIVAMAHLEPAANPMAGFPTIKAVPKKLPVVLSIEEIERLLATPRTDTVLALRDRALLALLYGTGVRASECAGMRQGDVDLGAMTVTVIGKGGHQRTIPLNERVAAALDVYARARGAALPGAAFFRSRRGRAMSRAAIYERVRAWGMRARIPKIVSPHRLRHYAASPVMPRRLVKPLAFRGAERIGPFPTRHNSAVLLLSGLDARREETCWISTSRSPGPCVGTEVACLARTSTRSPPTAGNSGTHASPFGISAT